MPEKENAALNTQQPIPSDRDAKVGCAICTVNFLHAPEFDWRGNKTAQEVFNYLEVLAKDRGWAYYFDGPNAVSFVCPTCRAKLDANQKTVLPRYREQSVCAACGYKTVSTQYCTGINLSVCRFGQRPHLHRQCGRCGYVWVEGCLNDPLTEVVVPALRKISAREKCRAGKDGECFWADCPQNRDKEPGKTGRSCPLYRKADFERE